MKAVFLKITRIGIYLILFTPLVLAPVGLTFSAFPKAVFFRSLVEIIFVFYLLLVVLDRKYLPKLSSLGWLILGFILIFSLATVAGINPFRSFFGDLERAGGAVLQLHFLVFFLILSGIGLGKEDWSRIFKITVGVGGLVSLTAVFQKIGVWSFYGTSLPGRVSGTLSNPDFFGPYIVLSIFLTVFVLLIENKKDLKITWGSILGLHLLTLVLCRTRGAWAALGLALIFCFFLWFFKYSTSGAWRKRIGFLFLFLSLILLFLVVNKENIDNSLLNRGLSVFELSFGSRGDVWEISLKAWKEKPILGWGPESFSYVFSKYFKSDYLSEIPEGMYFDYAHNKIFGLMVGSGLLGLFSWLTVIGTSIYLVLKRTFQEKYDSLIFSGFLVACFFQSLSVFDTISVYILLFLVLAFISRFYGKERELRINKKCLIVVAPFLIVACLISFYYLNLKTVIASSYFPRNVSYESAEPVRAIRGYKKGSEKGVLFKEDFKIVTAERGLLMIKERNEDERIVRILYSLAPSLERYLQKPDRRTNNVYWFLAQIYEENYLHFDEGLDKMENILKRALGFNDERPEFYRMMGELELIKGNREKAEEWFRKSSLMFPKPFLQKTYYYRDLGTGLLKTGQKKEAGEYLEKVVDRLYAEGSPSKENLGFIESSAVFFCEELRDEQRCRETFSKLKELAPRYRDLIEKRYRELEKENFPD